MSNFFKYLPGYRTDITWKKIIATIYYLFCLLLLFTSGVGAFLIIVTIPFILFAIISIIKDKTKTNALTIFICGVLLFSSGIKFDDKKQLSQTITNNKIQTEQKVIAKKNAIKTSIAYKKTVANKKIADANAIIVKTKQDAINQAQQEHLTKTQAAKVVPPVVHTEAKSVLSPSQNVNFSASIDNTSPTDNTRIHLTVSGPGGTYSAVCHYKSKDTIYNGNVGSPIIIDIGRVAKKYTVDIDIGVHYNGQAYNTSTSFTPQ